MDYRKKFLVKPGSKVNLNKIDPDFTDVYENKEEALEQLEQNTAKLAELQYKLYSENKQSLLIVLQAMDAGGKDGTIKHVMGPMNPQSCRVHSYKQPSSEELDHDFLWRIHRFAPRNGEVVIYNRSHYEDVLVVRVHDLVPKEIWSRRYEFINDFEKMLSFHKVKIVKLFLHITQEEQLKRFRKRLERPDKQWKISECDYKERQYWNDYTKAFEDAMEKCSTCHSPWYIIPANHKWFRNLSVSQILIDTMEDMKMKLPEPEVDIEHIRLLAIAEEEKARNTKKNS
ncbi:MAG: polyphosphate kinase 2 family protein [Lentisphaerae bacterium]|nr:polyphosphate kinase 2 family protein [Lentisphaerota bacterium]MCP4103698.1 polyphosphate kinase 2 family protein [Lentisphaerota bacterium]